ncbi:MAG: hypothetical protein QM689_05770 [Oscillospiraceae bacterium]
MKLKKLLAGATALMMGVSMVMTGCGKEDDSDKDNSKKDAGVKATLSTVVDSLREAQLMSSGQANKSYTANLKFTPGALLTTMTGVDIKPIELNTVTKSKGGKLGADYTVSYDGAKFISANVVNDATAKIAYVKIPELSDAYLTYPTDQLANVLSGDLGASTASVPAFDADASADMIALVEGVSNLWEGYYDAALAALPAGTDKDDLTGTINGVNYTLKTKTVEISEKDLIAVLVTLLNKAKDDAALKSLILDNKTITELLATEGVTIDANTFSTSIDSAINELNTELLSAETTKYPVDVYYHNDKIAGLSVTAEGTVFSAFTYETDSAFACKTSVTADGEGLSFEMGGTTENNVTNAKGVMTVTSPEASFTANLELQNITPIGDSSFSGNVNITAEVEGQSLAINIVSASTTAKNDITITASMSGVELGKLQYTSEETAASDITLPTGTAFDATTETGLSGYSATIDPTALETKLKTALGDDLFNSLFGYDDEAYTDDFAISNETALAS